MGWGDLSWGGLKERLRDGVKRGGVGRSVMGRARRVVMRWGKMGRGGAICMGRTGTAVMGWGAARRNEIRWLQLL